MRLRGYTSIAGAARGVGLHNRESHPLAWVLAAFQERVGLTGPSHLPTVELHGRRAAPRRLRYHHRTRCRRDDSPISEIAGARKCTV